MQINYHIRRIMFASRLNYVVMPYEWHLIPSALLQRTMEMMPLLSVMTCQQSQQYYELLGLNKIIFDDQPTYDKVKESRLVVTSFQKISQCHYCDR